MTELGTIPAVAIWPGVVAAVVAPLGAYVVASRKMSGKINTSDASDLWKESSLMRDDYRERLLASGERTSGLEERVAKLEGFNVELLRENVALKEKITVLETVVLELKSIILELRVAIAGKDAEIAVHEEAEAAEAAQAAVRRGEARA